MSEIFTKQWTNEILEHDFERKNIINFFKNEVAAFKAQEIFSI